MAKPRPTTCKTCGNPISQENTDRPRLYCSDKCRHYEADQRRLKGCKVEGCLERPTARGYCPTHYYQAKNRGEFGRICSVEGCGRPHTGRGLCSTHLQRVRKSEGPPCAVDGCDKPSIVKGLCAMHNWRHRKTGDVGPAGSVKRDDGEGNLDVNGYINVQIANRRILQHRLVMEQTLGRPLLQSESVHHINGKRDDNRPENLELWSKAQPAGQRVVDKVAFAIELLALYQPDALKT